LLDGDEQAQDVGVAEAIGAGFTHREGWAGETRRGGWVRGRRGAGPAGA
jgi:diadenosine tetraphosphatase ApaH/serine/threonine PP2A family protein phosphatase